MNLMNNKQNRHEQGQIIVLLAVSLVIVMVVAALAVDGGMIYSERRYVQNVADSASLAGGGIILHSMEHIDGNSGEKDITAKYFLCPNEVPDPDSDEEIAAHTIIAKAIDDAIERAQIVASDNNFPGLQELGRIYNGVPESIEGDHGIVIECVSGEKENYINVEVRVSSQISTAFAHLIFPGPLKTSNVAVTQVEPTRNVGFGNAIISLSEVCQNNTDGMEFTGTGDITVYGGEIHSNSCITGNGNVEVYVENLVPSKDTEGNIIYDENGDIVYEYALVNGTITLGDESAILNGGAVIKPDPIQDEELVTIPYLEPPTCSAPISTPNNAQYDFKQGSYPSGIKITNGTYTFEPGVYCINGDFEISGGTVTGYGVMFYMEDGDVRITGNASVQLTAPTSGFWAGMLFYMDPDNSGLIYLVGTDQSYFSGTVLAPSGNIEAGGTSEGITLDEAGCDTSDGCYAATFNVQLIANYVKIVGTSEIDVTFDESSDFFVVGKLFLLQ